MKKSEQIRYECRGLAQLVEYPLMSVCDAHVIKCGKSGSSSLSPPTSSFVFCAEES